MKVCVTGGRGFIGRNLIESLSRKYEVLAPTHSELELTSEEAVEDFFRKGAVDVVVHCAVKPGHRNARDPQHQLYVNTRMFFNLVRNARRFRKLICVGSGAVYDVRHPMVKVREDYLGAHLPADEHGLFRYVSTHFIEGMENWVDLRPFSVFGKYEDYEIRFISNAICKTLFDLPITIKQNRRFDFIFVDDLVWVIEYFIEHDGKFKAYNVTPDHSVELREVAETVRRISRKDLPIRVAREGMGLEYSGDNRRLREEVSGLTFTPLDRAIGELYDWYSSRRDRINREFLLVDK
jgi:GDP-L-fucose synthase